MDQEKQENIHKKKLMVSIPQAIVVAGVLISLSVIFSSSQSSNTSAELGSVKQVPIPEVTEADFILGNKNAEITLVEYSDFSCGFCARYHPTMKQIVAEYDGKVRWVYRHLPIFNKPAAVSASCVGNTLGDTSFFSYTDTLFANQKNIDSALLKREALALGMTDSDYEACINDKELQDTITKEFTAVRVLAGFNATPYSVLIDKKGNMHPFSGALPYEEVSALIDSLLAS